MTRFGAVLVAVAAQLASVSAPSPVSERTDPTLTVIAADDAERAALAEAVDRFRSNHLDLPDLEVRFSDDPARCHGHEGWFQPNVAPARVLVCGELEFVITHELAHAWVAANLDAADRDHYMAARQLTSWNDHTAPWTERGTEDAAFMIQQNLMMGSPRRWSATWLERADAYELLTGRRSPLRSAAVGSGQTHGGDDTRMV
jgi:hypothetical protein